MPVCTCILFFVSLPKKKKKKDSICERQEKGRQQTDRRPGDGGGVEGKGMHPVP